MVFYRKYRPQKIEELDSRQIKEKLYSVLKSSSVHAFLFTGPKGLGKTSTARIIAKVLNCERRNVILSRTKDLKSKRDSSSAFGETQNDNQNNIEPCNKCDQCVSITRGTNLDVLEIDGASNRGIDEIRDLREKVKLSPARAVKKVYIIDEVHMLTTEAFNALLKTLEEPPSHVVFILCTTEPHKVPSTIVSRCFRIQFNRATSSELISSFERIIKSEKLRVDKEALDLIASLSDGSFRDGSKILEEMVFVASGSKLTKELVEEKYQISNIKYQISQMLEMLVNRDVKKTLDHVSRLVDQGMDMGYFMQQLIQVLHNHFLYKAGVQNSSKFKVSREARSRSAGQNSKLDLGIEDTKKLIELLAKAHSELKYAVLPQLPLELAIVEWSLVKQGSHRPLARGPVASPSTGATPRPSGLDSFWKELIDKVKKYNHSVAGVLRGCKVISYDKNKLIIEAGFKFHKERLDDPKTKEIIKKAVKGINGRTIDVEVVLKN